MYKQGDIILVKFPFSNLTGAKLRPAVIISRNSVNESNDFVCLQITSKIFHDNFFFTLEKNFTSAPLKLESGIRLQKVFTAHSTVIDRRITDMKPSCFDKLLKTFIETIL